VQANEHLRMTLRRIENREYNNVLCILTVFLTDVRRITYKRVFNRTDQLCVGHVRGMLHPLILYFSAAAAACRAKDRPVNT